LLLNGGRSEIRSQAVVKALALLDTHIRDR
jgi:hypothetical protein